MEYVIGGVSVMVAAAVLYFGGKYVIAIIAGRYM